MNHGEMANPNILFIQADQLCPHALRFHGNQVSVTPNFDRLMEQGTVFRQRTISSPLLPSCSIYFSASYCRDLVPVL